MKIDNNYSVKTDVNNFVLRYENKYFYEKSKKEKLPQENGIVLTWSTLIEFI